MKIAIKSVKWTFHEVAAKKYFPNEQRIDIIEEKNIDSLINCIKNWKSDYWVIEIENTITWTIYNHLNHLIDDEITIKWETYINVEKNLAALPWATLDGIKYACWEYTAIEQTRKFFEKYPNITLVEVWDLSLAGRDIKNKNITNVGLIWWKLAAKLYWLNILIDKIDTENKNYTRFFIIKKKTEETEEKFNKATIHMHLPNQVGSLMKTLWVITAYGINVTKIESVPIPGEPFHYSFFIDITFPHPQYFYDMMTAIKPLLKDVNILWKYMNNDKILWDN